jgi:hypothetical protein
MIRSVRRVKRMVVLNFQRICEERERQRLLAGFGGGARLKRLKANESCENRSITQKSLTGTGCLPHQEQCVCLPERRKGSACRLRHFPSHVRQFPTNSIRSDRFHSRAKAAVAISLQFRAAASRQPRAADACGSIPHPGTSLWRTQTIHSQIAGASRQRRAHWNTTDIIAVRTASVRRNGADARLAGHHARGEGSRSRSTV